MFCLDILLACGFSLPICGLASSAFHAVHINLSLASSSPKSFTTSFIICQDDVSEHLNFKLKYVLFDLSKNLSKNSTGHLARCLPVAFYVDNREVSFHL